MRPRAGNTEKSKALNEDLARTGLLNLFEMVLVSFTHDCFVILFRVLESNLLVEGLTGCL